MRESLESGNFGGRYDLTRPPELTAEMAAGRLTDVNRLLHSLVVLHSDLRERRTLTHVIRSARALVSAPRGLLRVWDHAGGGCRVRSDLGFPRETRGLLADARRMASAAVLSRKPLLVSNPPDEVLAAELRLMGGGSCLTVPILPGGEAWGVLQLLRSESFREEDAILVWLYVMVLEEVLAEGSRGGLGVAGEFREADADLLDAGTFQRRVDEEINRSVWSGRSLSLLRIVTGVGGHEPFKTEDLPSPAVRVVRRSFRPGTLMGAGADGELLLLLRGAGASEARRLLAMLRRNLVQSQALAKQRHGTAGLRLGSATFPQDGRSFSELMAALGNIVEGAEERAGS